jgi:glycosyltransferase involved in cell wall biosynthesis
MKLETNDGDRETADLGVVIPTFNERENIRPLLARLEAALNGIRWEAIFVDDDSPDGTADLVRQLARESPHVRVVHRIAGADSRAHASKASFLRRPPISL